MANLWDPVVVFDGSQAAYWDTQTLDGATTLVPLDPSLVTGSILEVRFARTVPAGVREDLAMFRMCWSVEAGPGAPMSRLDASDAARLETAFDTNFWFIVKPFIANDWTLKEYAWRHFGADFPLDKNGFSKPGPYWRVTSFNSAGTNTSARLPDQVAITVTHRTASRKHWGRFYIGGFTTTSLVDAQMGHIVPATVDAMALGTNALYNDVYNDARKTWPVVWSARYRSAMSVNEVSVDDTFDIIRRRRAKFPTYRKTYVA